MISRAGDPRRAEVDRNPTGGPIRVAAVTGGVWTVIMLARLFTGGIVGMADQGDGRRLMCQLAVRAARPFSADPSKFVTPTWVAHRWYGEACGADGSGEPYRSSQLWLLRLTKALTPVLHLPGALDLRLLGVICTVLVGLAIAALVVSLPGPMPFRVVIASLFGLAAADASVAEYFISAYSEPAALVGIFALCAALLWLWRPGYPTWPRLTLVAAAATFTMLAKTQTVALLPAVAVGVLWSGSPSEDSRPGRLGRIVGAITTRAPALFTCVALIIASVVYLGRSPKRFSQVASYDQVFLEILPHSSNRAADLRSLGVDPTLATSSGANIVDPRSAARRPQYLAFRDTVSQTTILRFYATHPGRLIALGAQGLRAVTIWRQDYLGTYTAGSGHPPGARECRVCIYAAVFTSARALPIVIPGLWLLTLLAGIRVVRDPRLDMTQKTLGRLAVVIVIATVCQFWAVMLTEGISDLYKHMIFTNLLTALCIPTLFGCLWLSRFRPRPIVLPPQTPSLWQ